MQNVDGTATSEREAVVPLLPSPTFCGCPQDADTEHVQAVILQDLISFQFHSLVYIAWVWLRFPCTLILNELLPD